MFRNYRCFLPDGWSFTKRMEWQAAETYYKRMRAIYGWFRMDHVEHS